MRMSSSDANEGISVERPVGVPDARPRVIAEDARFVALLDGFRPSGGIAALRELRRRARWTLESSPAFERWQSEGRILGIDWNGESWFPLLQFQRVSMKPEPVMQCLLAELHGTLAPWDFATWLITPTGWLEGAAPAAMLRVDPGAVMRAARADRFLAT